MVNYWMQEIQFIYQGNQVSIRKIGEDYFTGKPWLGVFFNGEFKLVTHGDSVRELKTEAKRLILKRCKNS
jgi:hypothetical protein